MYIIGNADTARPVQMWSEVLILLARDGNIGDAIELRCPRHRRKQIIVQKPEDFLLHAPDGGCDVPCGKQLDNCIHTCPDKCHSAELHGVVVCQQKCMRGLPGCYHTCPLICGKQCENCVVNIPQVVRPCGHFCTNIPCHEAQLWYAITCTLNVPWVVLPCGHYCNNMPCDRARRPELLRCETSVSKTIPGCGHEQNIPCHVDVTKPDFKCTLIFDKELECGHTRAIPCRVDVTKSDFKCTSICGKELECGHSCAIPCHPGVECGRCDRPCEFGCSHSKCPKKCPVPCDILPCDKRCGLLLRCGHQCPSLCGESCPSHEFCHQCASASIRSRVVDMSTTTYQETDLNANPVIFPHCGHFLTVRTMDASVGMGKVYVYAGDSIIRPRAQQEWTRDINPTLCSECQHSLASVNRYSRISKGVRMVALTQGLMREGTQKALVLEQEVKEMVLDLDHTRVQFSNDVNASLKVPTAAAANVITNLKKKKKKSYSYTYTYQLDRC